MGAVIDRVDEPELATGPQPVAIQPGSLSAFTAQERPN
jgi:hypothetical protein